MIAHFCDTRSNQHRFARFAKDDCAGPVLSPTLLSENSGEPFRKFMNPLGSDPKHFSYMRNMSYIQFTLSLWLRSLENGAHECFRRGLDEPRTPFLEVPVCQYTEERRTPSNSNAQKTYHTRRMDNS